MREESLEEIMSVDKAFEVVPPGKVEPLGPGVLSFIPLRAYLAAHAPEAVFVDFLNSEAISSPEDFATIAVRYADALLAELAKEPK